MNKKMHVILLHSASFHGFVSLVLEASGPSVVLLGVFPTSLITSLIRLQCKWHCFLISIPQLSKQWTPDHTECNQWAPTNSINTCFSAHTFLGWWWQIISGCKPPWHCSLILLRHKSLINHRFTRTVKKFKTLLVPQPIKIMYFFQMFCLSVFFLLHSVYTVRHRKSFHITQLIRGLNEPVLDIWFWPHYCPQSMK